MNPVFTTEAAMAATRGVRPVTLGWQGWSVIVIILVLVVLAGVLALMW